MIDQLLEILPQVVTALTLVTAVFLTSLWLGMVLVLGLRKFHHTLLRKRDQSNNIKTIFFPLC